MPPRAGKELNLLSSVSRKCRSECSNATIEAQVARDAESDAFCPRNLASPTELPSSLLLLSVNADLQWHSRNVAVCANGTWGPAPSAPPPCEVFLT